jgi:nitroreductase
MKKIIVISVFVCFCSSMFSQDLKPIELLKPNKTRGLSVMQALEARASAREWSSQKLNLQDLSDLMWAADGINRPAEGKRTAASAMNAQDIDVYVLMEEGAYVYDAQKHFLNPVATGDYRDLTGKTDAPVTIVLVSDLSRFRAGDDAQKLGWANIDCGIVSQNIALFCSGNGIKTRPRASFPGADKIREALKLKDSQKILLNQPVGYEKKQ